MSCATIVLVASAVIAVAATVATHAATWGYLAASLRGHLRREALRQRADVVIGLDRGESPVRAAR